jgi:hypothetical protein
LKQKGIVSYGVAPNRQNPLAGAFHDAIFNTWRRFRNQVVYFAPPFIAGYYVLNWAIERYATPIYDWEDPALTDRQERVPQLQGWPCRVWRRGISGTQGGLAARRGTCVI